MKTTTTENKRTPALEPYAFAIAGEQAFDYAYAQLAQFRPGGANYRRLRMLQDVGQALNENGALYAAAPDLLQACCVALGALEDIRTGRNPAAGAFARTDLERVIAKAKGQP